MKDLSYFFSVKWTKEIFLLCCHGRNSSFNFSLQRSDGGNHSQFFYKSLASALSSTSAPVPKFRMTIGIGRQALSPKVVLTVLVQIIFARNLVETIRISVKLVDVCFGCGKLGHHIWKCRVVAQ